MNNNCVDNCVDQEALSQNCKCHVLGCMAMHGLKRFLLEAEGVQSVNTCYNVLKSSSLLPRVCKVLYNRKPSTKIVNFLSPEMGVLTQGGTKMII